jgi:hypothetical protein
VPVELARCPSPTLLRAEMSPAGFTDVVEQREQWPFTVHDAEACRAKVYSCLQLISEEAFDPASRTSGATSLRGRSPQKRACS